MLKSWDGSGPKRSRSSSANRGFCSCWFGDKGGVAGSADDTLDEEEDLLWKDAAELKEHVREAKAEKASGRSETWLVDNAEGVRLEKGANFRGLRAFGGGETGDGSDGFVIGYGPGMWM